MDIEAGHPEGSNKTAHNGEKELHQTHDCFHPDLSEVIISAEKQ